MRTVRVQDSSLVGILREDSQHSARKRRSRSRSVLRENLLTAASVEEEDNDHDKEKQIRFGEF